MAPMALHQRSILLTWPFDCDAQALDNKVTTVLGFCRYASYYLTRNSLTYTAPVMVADKALNMDITQVCKDSSHGAVLSSIESPPLQDVLCSQAFAKLAGPAWIWAMHFHTCLP